jgi:hypothetical protein
MSLFVAADSAWEREIRGLNVDLLTPLEALNKLAEWKRRLK